MSFVTDLFGGSSTSTSPVSAVAAPAPPRPLPAAPTISSAQVQGEGIEAANRLRRRRGFDKTILGSSALGDSAPAANIQHTTLLGGGA